MKLIQNQPLFEGVSYLVTHGIQPLLNKTKETRYSINQNVCSRILGVNQNDYCSIISVNNKIAMDNLTLQLQSEKIKHIDPLLPQAEKNTLESSAQKNNKYKKSVESSFRKYCISKLLSSKQAQVKVRQSGYGMCVYFDTQKFSYQSFQNLLNLLEGKIIKIQRDLEIIMFIKASKIFQLQQLQNLLQNDLKDNKDQYNIFSLLLISEKCSINWLKQDCVKQLIKFNFQQISFNLYDLIQFDRQSFESVLLLHKKLVKDKVCKGQPYEIIKQTIHMYCQANCTIVEEQKFLPQQLDCIAEQSSQDDQDGSQRKANDETACR